MEGVGETCPEVRRRARSSRGAAASGRSPAARATPTATTSSDRPAAARAAAVRGRRAPRMRDGPPRGAPSAPDRQRLLRLLALPEVRLHDDASRSARSTTRTTGPVARDGEALASACGAARRSTLPEDGDPVGVRLLGGPPDPGRAGATARGRGAGQDGRPAQPAGAGAHAKARRRRPTRGAPAAAPRDGRQRRSSGFLGALAARDASEHTRRAYATAVAPVPRRGWPSRPDDRLAATRRGSCCAPIWPSSMAVACARRSIAARSRRCARSTATLAARAGSRAIHGPPSRRRAEPRRLPAVLEVGEVEDAPRRASVRSPTAPDDGQPGVRRRAGPA